MHNSHLFWYFLASYEIFVGRSVYYGWQNQRTCFHFAIGNNAHAVQHGGDGALIHGVERCAGYACAHYVKSASVGSASAVELHGNRATFAVDAPRHASQAAAHHAMQHYWVRNPFYIGDSVAALVAEQA